MDSRALSGLIDNITQADSITCDRELVQALKAIVRSSDVALKQAYQLILARLADQHAQTRYLALQLAGFLFQRSVMFRELLCRDFAQFVELVLGLDVEHPLPPPRNFATLLRDRALELIEEWHSDFGAFFAELQVGYRYLKGARGVRFPEVRSGRAAERQRVQAQEAEARSLAIAKYQQARSQMRESASDVRALLSQLDALFAIVVPDFAATGEDSSSQDVFCVCKAPYQEGTFMVGCEGCQDWFHPECVGLSREQAEAAESFTCPRCQEKGKATGQQEVPR